MNTSTYHDVRPSAELFSINDYLDDPSDTVYIAIDLHKNNAVLCAVTTDNTADGLAAMKTLQCRRYRTLDDENIAGFEKAIADLIADKPHRIVCESTYNWYWLADLCERNEWRFCLCDPSTVSQSHVKTANDYTDAEFLAKRFWMRELRLAQVLSHEDRAVRDLIRERQCKVQERARVKTIIRNKIVNHLSKDLSYSKLCQEMKDDALREISRADALQVLLHDPNLALEIECHFDMIDAFEAVIAKIEARIQTLLNGNEAIAAIRQQLGEIKGCGPILANVIASEIGTIDRFANAKQFVSYCRLAPTVKLSNGKIKGTGNAKNGNAYLSWALTELSILMLQHCPEGKRYYLRKRKSQGMHIMAIRSTALKLARAIYYVLSTGVIFDPKKTFG